MDPQPPSDPKDVELEQTIIREIRELGAHMHVSVRGGHATVSGTADDFETKREIMSVVQGIPGVHQVTNNIRVARVAD
jgi:osmotically-inducible protein OsmY